LDYEHDARDADIKYTMQHIGLAEGIIDSAQIWFYISLPARAGYNRIIMNISGKYVGLLENRINALDCYIRHVGKKLCFGANN